MQSEFSDIDLARYFSGECSPEEKEAIEQWSNATAANMEMFRAARFVWEKGIFAETETYDTEKALSVVHRKLDGNKNFRLRIYLKIAAIAAVILLPVVLFFLLPGDNTGEQVTYTEVSSDQNQRFLKLGDGTEIWLNSNSKIFVPETKTSGEMMIKLSGEAYFEVAKNSNRVFIVETKDALVKVLGTAFNIKAGEEESFVLSVTEGKVLCSGKSPGVEKIVEKGNEAKWNPRDGKIELRPMQDENFLAWKTRILRFREKPLRDVATDLEAYYKVRFEVDSALYNLPVTTTLVDVPVDKVVELLRLASDQMVIEHTSGGIRIKSKE